MVTVHIQAKKSEIAKIVIMPGDPLRAKYIAEKFLKNYKLINSYRNMLGYTGYYKNKKITVMGSGMGTASMGIYSYELFKNYGVNKIIRIGTCGSYQKKYDIKDVVVVKGLVSMSSYLQQLTNKFVISDLKPSLKLLDDIINIAKNKNIQISKVIANCSDTFYTTLKDNWKTFAKISDVVEMESLALYANAKVLNKEAICLLTVSDSFLHDKILSPLDREKSLNNMIEIALEVK